MTCIDLHHFFFHRLEERSFSHTKQKHLQLLLYVNQHLAQAFSFIFVGFAPRSKSDRHRLSRKSAKKPENWEEKTAVQKRKHAKNFSLFGKGLFLTYIDRHSTYIKKMQKSPKNWENVGA